MITQLSLTVGDSIKFEITYDNKAHETLLLPKVFGCSFTDTTPGSSTVNIFSQVANRSFVVDLYSLTINGSGFSGDPAVDVPLINDILFS